MFLSAGFEIVQQYGDYRFVRFDRTSPYVVTVVRRPGHVGQGVDHIGRIDIAPFGSRIANVAACAATDGVIRGEGEWQPVVSQNSGGRGL
ncbi:MAG: hypothetical protein ACRD2X_13550 [Vicinamibacteraceae bacterium]